MKKLLAFGLILSGAAAQAQAACRAVSGEEWEKLTPKRIVFFASWCKSCEEHLKPEYADGAVFVNSYDDAKQADAMMKKYFGEKQPTCVLDEGEVLAHRYGVKYLPFVKELP